MTGLTRLNHRANDQLVSSNSYARLLFLPQWRRPWWLMTSDLIDGVENAKQAAGNLNPSVILNFSASRREHHRRGRRVKNLLPELQARCRLPSGGTSSDRPTRLRVRRMWQFTLVLTSRSSHGDFSFSPVSAHHHSERRCSVSLIGRSA